MSHPAKSVFAAGLMTAAAAPILLNRPLVSCPFIAVIAAHPHHNDYEECHEDCSGSWSLEQVFHYSFLILMSDLARSSTPPHSLDSAASKMPLLGQNSLNESYETSCKAVTDTRLTRLIFSQSKPGTSSRFIVYYQWIGWCPHTDSNRGPTDYKSVALPAEL